MNLNYSEAMKAIQRFNDWQLKRERPVNSQRLIAIAGTVNSLFAGYALYQLYAPF
jgi:hypothetical protein